MNKQIPFIAQQALNKINKLSEEELNNNIKKYFGEEYLIQEETLSKLYPFLILCHKCLRYSSITNYLL